jgi:hypothetical protein
MTAVKGDDLFLTLFIDMDFYRASGERTLCRELFQ